MKRGSFDVETSKEMVGDTRTRIIEADAREAAEMGREAPQGLRSEGTGSYWDRAMACFEVEVWEYALNKRKARLKRMKEV